jgi:FKBP-type peptidyl-prolyl cis-trans isomerase
MQPGERSILKLTSEYGYGDSGSPPRIPGKATLIFEVELISFKAEKKQK